MKTKDYLKDIQHTQRIMKELSIEIPDALGPFLAMERSNAMQGSLQTKTKELISLAMAISQQSIGCITVHMERALKAGASREQILETIGVAIRQGGSPAAMAGCEAYEILQSLTSKAKPTPALLYDE